MYINLNKHISIEIPLKTYSYASIKSNNSVSQLTTETISFNL